MKQQPAPRRGVVILSSVISLAVGGVVGYYAPHPAPEMAIVVSTPPPSATPPPTPTPRPLRVHVAGAVERPGVYELRAGSIVLEAIEAAGGPAPGAEPGRINLALELRDQQQVYLPAAGEPGAPPPVSGGVGGGKGGGEAININTATPAELEALPRIGPATAAKIVAYRETNGPFESIEEIQDVPGIGPATFEGLKELITVGW